jgi:SAM-dependent methyltransferase
MASELHFKSLRTNLVRLVRKSYILTIVAYIIDDLLVKGRYKSGIYNTESGSAHADLELDDSIRYIEEVFNDYKNYSGLNQFYGSVAEIGPGDNAGVGLLFLSDGCTRVDLVDRFYSKRDPQRQARIYSQLFNKYESLHKLGLDNYDESQDFHGLSIKFGPNASAEEYFTVPDKFNFIVSRAVLEHVYNPILALRRMVDALKDDGMLLHKVDLRDHAMFSEYFHELKFLEVPDYIYKQMTMASGRPNRVMITEYRAVLDELPISYKLLVTRLAGVGEITPHKSFDEIPEELKDKSRRYVSSVRHKFTRRIRNLPLDDLCTAGFFLIARKLPRTKLL